MKNSITQISPFFERVEETSPPLGGRGGLILFDMDGVLFDSMPAHAQAWTQAMRELDIPFTEQDAYLHEGRTGSSTINAFFTRYKNREATLAEQQVIYRRKTELFERHPTPAPMPCALSLLQKLKAEGFTIGVVTGSAQASLIDHLNVHFPDIFSEHLMVTAFDVHHGKPHPEPYLMALQKAGVSAREALVVENAPLGVQSARAADITTIAVNTGILPDEVLRQAGADLVISGGIPELYERWE